MDYISNLKLILKYLITTNKYKWSTISIVCLLRLLTGYYTNFCVTFERHETANLFP